MTDSHLIEHLQVDIGIAGDAPLPDAETRLAAFAQGPALQIIDALFDEACAGDEVWRIDTLTVDLGEVLADDMEHTWAVRLRERLAQQLADLRGPAGAAASWQPGGGVQRSRPQARLEALLYFLQQGHLPWHVRGDDPQHLADEVLQHSADALAAALRVVDDRPRLLRRLAVQFEARWLAALVQALMAGEPAAAQRLLQATRASTAAGRGTAGAALLWQAVLEQALVHPSAPQGVTLALLRAQLVAALAAGPVTPASRDPLRAVASAWAPLLQQDAAWLRATLQRLGDSPAVHQRLALALPEGLLLQVLALLPGEGTPHAAPPRAESAPAGAPAAPTRAATEPAGAPVASTRAATGLAGAPAAPTRVSGGPVGAPAARATHAARPGLNGLARSTAPGDKSSAAPHHHPQVQLQALLHYLRHGHLPAQGAHDPQQLAAGLLQHSATALAAALRAMDERALGLRRLALQFDAHLLASLVQALMPGEPAAAARLLLAAAPALRAGHRADNLVRLWEAVLGEALDHAGGSAGTRRVGLPLLRAQLRVALDAGHVTPAGRDPLLALAHAWAPLLQGDRAWLQAALQQLGQSTPVRQRIARALPVALWPAVAALWLGDGLDLQPQWAPELEPESERDPALQARAHPQAGSKAEAEGNAQARADAQAEAQAEAETHGPTQAHLAPPREQQPARAHAEPLAPGAGPQALAALLHYLHHGHLPLQATGHDPQQLATQVLRHRAAALATALRAVDDRPRLTHRLAVQFDARWLGALVHTLMPGQPAAAARLLALAGPAAGPGSSGVAAAAAVALWAAVLDQALAHGTSAQAPDASVALRRAQLQAVLALEQAAPDSLAQIAPAWAPLLQNDAAWLQATLQRLGASAAARQRIVQAVPAPMRAPVVALCWGSGLTGAVQAWIGSVAQGGPATSHALAARHQLLWQATLQQALQGGATAFDATAYAEQVRAQVVAAPSQAAPRWFDRAVRAATAVLARAAAALGGHAAAPAGPLAAPPQAPEPPAPAWAFPPPAPAQTLPVGNAGLVLLAPYLPRLFIMLGLADARAFTGPPAVERAVQLLQLLVTGQPDAPEPALVLNKLLCGLAQATPVARVFEPTPAESQAIDGLLAAVIAHWKVLGSTSPGGLRETFLQRTGRLEARDEAWQLQVVPGPFDMLIDQLPWGYALIRYPWMEQVLHVDWR